MSKTKYPFPYHDLEGSTQYAYENYFDQTVCEEGTFQYSNVNFMIAQTMALKATNTTSWAKFMDKYFARPLNLVRVQPAVAEAATTGSSLIYVTHSASAARWQEYAFLPREFVDGGGESLGCIFSIKFRDLIFFSNVFVIMKNILYPR